MFMYNPIDCYWFVAGDLTQVWASGRMMYVPFDDAAYQTWLAPEGSITSTNPAQADLADVMVEQALPLYFGTGIIITSDSTPSINSTYALDADSYTLIGNTARDVASGLGFAIGTTTTPVIDLAGNVQTLTESNVLNLYKAMRMYMAQTQTAVVARVMGGTPDLPSNVVGIP